MLMDEIPTPDSSRYFYLEGYEERQSNNQEQKQLSKEFVRKWLIENGFQGKEGQNIPAMSDEWLQEISLRYIELFEKVTGKKFVKPTNSYSKNEVEQIVNTILSTLK
jgi:phosphoribosylaminoimidazole-succinocarboxamide synthase